MKTNKTKFLSLIAMPFLSLVMLISFPSCSGDDDNSDPVYTCTTCSNSPDALAENNNTSKGVYKGIMVGSTGTISLNIQNGTNNITATMVIDGVSVALTSTAVVIAGEVFVAPFTGVYNGSPVSITFQVAANGTTPTMISSDIPGHPNAVFTLLKETSTSLVEAFEGTYSKTDGESGIFNIVLSSGLGVFGGVARNNQTGVIDNDVNGLYVNGQILSSSGIPMATITGDQMNGSFVGGDQVTVTIVGNRTL